MVGDGYENKFRANLQDSSGKAPDFWRGVEDLWKVRVVMSKEK